jgi:hypothetical protein
MRTVRTFCGVLLACACGFAQLSGMVRDSVSKAPLDQAKVTVLGAVTKTAESGNGGAFRIDDLRPGKYTVSAIAKGYDYGSATVEVSATGGSVTLDLAPWAEVEGQILDEDGKAIEGVQVYAGGGLRDITGKDGHYIAREIPAGKFEFMFRLSLEVRRATATHDAKTGETLGYASSMFYPGVADRKLSAPIAITAGARMSRFDVRLRRIRLADVAGKIKDAPEGTEVELDSAGLRQDEMLPRQELDEHGGFRFELVSPGEHNLVIFRNRPGDDLPYITPAVNGLEIVMPPFVKVQGMVHTERSEMNWGGALRVQLWQLGYSTEARVAPDGHFTMDNVPPGAWNLTLDDNMLHRTDDPSKRLYVAAIHGNLEKNARGSVLHVTEGGAAPLDILLTDQTGRLTGTADEVTAVTITALTGWTGRSRAAFPNADGSFAIDLPPGEYRVMLSGAPQCPAETITLEPGGTASVHLKACK